MWAELRSSRCKRHTSPSKWDAFMVVAVMFSSCSFTCLSKSKIRFFMNSISLVCPNISPCCASVILVCALSAASLMPNVFSISVRSLSACTITMSAASFNWCVFLLSTVMLWFLCISCRRRLRSLSHFCSKSFRLASAIFRCFSSLSLISLVTINSCSIIFTFLTWPSRARDSMASIWLVLEDFFSAASLAVLALRSCSAVSVRFFSSS
mmetsp:Transcript_27750/g.36371  ORF Transcript_27750/g.36371 Transcript_27750/m.36371 type:complete len:209 (-) Transcript_27750:128-754(-)